ncbi:sigma-70 family RNA polymerase sigma factor [Yinghuangia seranimata]|uniref:sigma-70 family RNA polymerase sigma factor n=1 Tax=Yinghuangia seranimata TaxID=408067 RepID=UPI00248B257E|nr:sigma-70 family RNA polymerase sigma factor [Yinghuangia seranimata]MDI2125470.1 sigma-70 family RNA polymerase sigma factor [Yinghuangia seranimata]
MTAPGAHSAIDAVWKFESARIIAGLTRMVHDVGLAEELAQDALVAALEQWPTQGVPDNPGAWLMTAAKRRAVDHFRRSERMARKHGEFARTLEQQGAEERDFEERVDDDVLRLMFVSCHPVLPADARAALTLRLLGGLTAAEIASAFLVSEQAVAQRIARAKRVLAEERIPFELPPGPELAGRLSSVLEVIYLIFNEGYTATSGDDLMRPSLCLEALRLGRLLAELAPRQAEVHGLVALMEIQASRGAARTGPSGEPVQLHEQNRARWDQLLIRRGFAAMLRAREVGGPPGPYVLQAAIAVSHAQARTADETDWRQIAALYDALIRLVPSPVVQLNRAVALGMAYGPQAGLDVVDTLTADPALKDYHLLSVVRGDLLTRLGRHAEAAPEFERAAALTRNAPERAFLLRRAADAPTRTAGVTLGGAVRDFLAREDLGAATVRSYGQTLHRLCLDLGPRTALADVTAGQVGRVFAVTWGATAAPTWNRHRAAVRSFSSWASVADLAADVERRLEDRTGRPALGAGQLDALWRMPAVPLRERTLWRIVFESGAGAAKVLSVNVEDLDLTARCARVTAEGRTASVPVSWRSGAARLLPALVGGRTRGPLFLADRRPAPARTPAPADLCPDTGRGRLSYERAEYLFKQATKHLDPTGTGYTLSQLATSRRRL